MKKPHQRPQWPTFNKNSYEKEAWSAQKYIVGVDEVGRGCLAGPVVTAAVILPINTSYRLLKDSKILKPEERLQAYNWIVKHCRFSIGLVHHRIVDTHNVWHATLIAMKKALLQVLDQSAIDSINAVVIDAMPLKIADTAYCTLPVHHFPFGELKSSSIAAASIVAKVTRDRLMEKFDQIFPGFELAQHKGYSTPKHKAHIRAIRHSIIHRLSYLNRTLYHPHSEESIHDKQQQQTLC